jgi:hypothetical protein
MDGMTWAERYVRCWVVDGEQTKQARRWFGAARGGAHARVGRRGGWTDLTSTAAMYLFLLLFTATCYPAAAITPLSIYFLRGMLTPVASSLFRAAGSFICLCFLPASCSYLSSAAFVLVYLLGVILYIWGGGLEKKPGN